MQIDSDRIKQLRAQRQWSQDQLASVCGLNLRTIQRLENTGKASNESVRALAAVFEVDASELILNSHGELSGSEESPTPISVVKRGFVQFANFSDQANRFEYWWFFVFAVLVMAIAELISSLLLALVSIVLLLPLIAVGTRRLNDAGYSAWWQLFFLVPFGFVPVLFLLAQPSQGLANAE